MWLMKKPSWFITTEGFCSREEPMSYSRDWIYTRLKHSLSLSRQTHLIWTTANQRKIQISCQTISILETNGLLALRITPLSIREDVQPDMPLLQHQWQPTEFAFKVRENKELNCPFKMCFRVTCQTTDVKVASLTECLTTEERRDSCLRSATSTLQTQLKSQSNAHIK